MVEPAVERGHHVSEQTPKPVPSPPSPAILAARKAAVPRPPAVTADPGAPAASPGPAAPAEAAVPTTPSESVRHGRVGEDGTVYVTLADGTEREVGSYPDASPEDALAYFARKYDELAASADLLAQRLAHTDVSAHDARQALAHLKEQIGDAHVVGVTDAQLGGIVWMDLDIRFVRVQLAKHGALAGSRLRVPLAGRPSPGTKIVNRNVVGPSSNSDSRTKQRRR